MLSLQLVIDTYIGSKEKQSTSFVVVSQNGGRLAEPAGTTKQAKENSLTKINKSEQETTLKALRGERDRLKEQNITQDKLKAQFEQEMAQVFGDEIESTPNRIENENGIERVAKQPQPSKKIQEIMQNSKKHVHSSDFAIVDEHHFLAIGSSVLTGQPIYGLWNDQGQYFRVDVDSVKANTTFSQDVINKAKTVKQELEQNILMVCFLVMIRRWFILIVFQRQQQIMWIHC